MTTLPLIVLIFLLFPVFSLDAKPPSSPIATGIDHIVAVVNDDVIVLSELNNRIRTVQMELQQGSAASPSNAKLRKQVLKRLILDRLQLQKAKNAGIQIDDERLNQMVASIAEKNRLSLNQFREILETDGYKFSVFRENIREQLMIREIQKRRVANRVQVTDREIDNYLSKPGSKQEREYHLAHILISVRDSADIAEVTAARRKAEQVIGQINAGENFAKLAITMSDGQKALEGGDLGWRKEKQLPSLFADAVPDMEPGEVSDPLLSTSGFHIVKLIDVRGNQRHIITQTKVRHILLRTDEMISDTDAEIRLEQLRERIVQGEDFEELAKSHSNDNASAIKGGNLGWVSPGEMVPKFEQAINKLGPMEVSPPFRSQFGWHIAQVIDRRKYDGTEKVRRAKARGEIRKRKIEEQLRAWLTQLRDEAYVEYRLEEFQVQ